MIPAGDLARGTNRPRISRPARKKSPLENDATLEEMSAIISEERRRRAIVQARLEIAADWLSVADHLDGCKRRGVADCSCGLWAAQKAVAS